MKCPHCENSLQQVGKFWVCPEHGSVTTAAGNDDGPREAAPASKASARLFLSYGRRDAADLAERLEKDLAGAGHTVWRDRNRIATGSDFVGEIEDGLRSTQIVIALLSPHAVRRSGRAGNPDDSDSVCLDELSFARFAKPPRRILPVMAAPCEPPFVICRLDYVDLCRYHDSEEQYQAGLQRILEGIEEALAGAPPRYRSWEDDLRPWDFVPYLETKRRNFIGREWLFADIDQWRQNREERALLVTGDPGTGKSAIVAALVHRNPGGQLLAYHCCQWDERETLRPARFVRSIAAMIATRLPDYAAQLEDAAVKDALSESRCEKDPASAFDEGVLVPLHKLQAPGEGCRYILVDALDEALRPGAAADDMGTNLVDVLASRLERLPPWLRLVATTRKEEAVLNRLKGLRAHRLEASDSRNLADLEQYIRERLRSPKLSSALASSRFSVDAVARTLVEKGAGNFQYVVQALEGVERSEYGFDQLDTLPPGLSGLYCRFFDRLFRPDIETRFAPVRGLLEMVVAAREPIDGHVLAAASGLDEETDLPRWLRTLAPYLPARTGEGGVSTYAFYHKSFADWLSDPSHSYHASAKRGHSRLADFCEGEYGNGAARMCGYALRHAPTHLVATARWDAVTALLCDLKYVDARCKKGQVFELVADYRLAQEHLPEAQVELEGQRELQAQVKQWTEEMVTYAKAWSDQAFQMGGSGMGSPGLDLPTPLATRRLRTESDFDAESRRIAMHPSLLDQLGAFATFVSSNVHPLRQHCKHQGFVFQHAHNDAPQGPVHCEAALRLRDLETPHFIRRWPRGARWNPRPALLSNLEGHALDVTGVDVTPDLRRAVSSSNDASLRVWDLSSGACLRVLVGHDDCVSSVSMSLDGSRAVSGSHDSTLRVWNLNDGESLLTLRGHSGAVMSVSMTPDGRSAVSGGHDGSLRVWNLESGDCRCTLKGHRDSVTSVSVTPDGRRAVSGSHDETVRLWDLENCVCLQTFTGHDDAVTGVSLTPDGREALSGSNDGTLRVWDTGSGRCLRTIKGRGWPILSVSVTPDGRRAVAGGEDASLQVWDVASGECNRVLKGHRRVVSAVRVTPDGRCAVSGSNDGSVRLWNLNEETKQHAAEDFSDLVQTVSVTPDGRHAVSASWDRALRVWDVTRGTCLKTITGSGGLVESLCVTPDGRRVVLAGWDETLRVVDLQSGLCLRKMEGHRGLVSCVGLTPDGVHGVSGNGEGSLNVWDLETGTCLRTLDGHRGTIYGVCLHPDGRHAVSASEDGTIRVWSLADGSCLRTLSGHRGWVRRACVTPDGRHVVSGGQDTTLRVWDAKTGYCLRTIEGHSDEVLDVSVTSEGLYALSGSRDNTLRLWELGTGTCVAICHVHHGINALALAGDSTAFVATLMGHVLFAEIRGTPSRPARVCGPDRSVSDEHYEAFLRRGLEFSRREKGPDHEETLAHLTALAVHLEKVGKPTEAAAFAKARDALGPVGGMH